MSYLDNVAGYLAGRHDATLIANAGPRGAALQCGPAHGEAAAIAAQKKTKKELETAQDAILDLKKRLVATRAVRDTLRTALESVAPDHPMLDMRNNNSIRQQIEDTAASIKKWDDPV